MFAPADLIDALRRRMRRSLRPERPPGEFPPGWSAWFAVLGERIGQVTGATAESIIALLVLREPRPASPASVALNRWQAFGSLWRQQWHPRSRDERGLHLTGFVVTALVHLVLAMLLLWLAYVRVALPPAAAEEGEATVQVEFIGRANPAIDAGGAPAGERDDAAPPATASAARAAALASGTQADQRRAPAPAPASPAAVEATARPPEPAEAPVAMGAQPLQVTAVPVPDTDFVLPAPTLRTPVVPRPEVAAPVIRAPSREVRVVEIGEPVPRVQPTLPRPSAALPQVRTPQVELRVRDIPSPLPSVPTPALPRPDIAVPDVRAQAPRLAIRDIPAPAQVDAGAPQAPAGAAPAQDSAAAPVTPASAAATARSPRSGGGGSPAVATGERPGASAARRGPATTAPAGASPTPVAGDDWGNSTRDRAGGQAGGPPGLFNADGSPRLGPGAAPAGGGLPPGVVEERIADLDRAGSWLKRKPNDYQPTTFDRYWVPHESLLAEWVRRSIKEVSIPVPGTSKRIRCVVALLAVGGSCGITDPNMLDIEANARAAPDVPFKPALQEDQDALRRPPGG